MKEDPKLFPAFRKSQLYIKLLAELDLLKLDSKEEGGMTAEEGGYSVRGTAQPDLLTLDRGLREEGTYTPKNKYYVS